MDFIKQIIALFTRMVEATERSAAAHERMANAYTGGVAATDSNAGKPKAGTSSADSEKTSSANGNAASADSTATGDDLAAQIKALPDKLKELIRGVKWNPLKDLEIAGRYGTKKLELLRALCEHKGVSFGTSTTGAELHERLLIAYGAIEDENAKDDPAEDTDTNTEAFNDDDGLDDLGVTEDDGLDDLGTDEETVIEFDDFKAALVAFNKKDKENRNKIAKATGGVKLTDVPENERRAVLETLGLSI